MTRPPTSPLPRGEVPTCTDAPLAPAADLALAATAIVGSLLLAPRASDCTDGDYFCAAESVSTGTAVLAAGAITGIGFTASSIYGFSTRSRCISVKEEARREARIPLPVEAPPRPEALSPIDDDLR